MSEKCDWNASQNWFTWGNMTSSPVSHFTDHFFLLEIEIIQWQLVQLQVIRSQQIFAHGNTAEPSSHLQNFVAIAKFKWEQTEISITIWIMMEKTLMKRPPGLILFLSLGGWGSTLKTEVVETKCKNVFAFDFVFYLNIWRAGAWFSIGNPIVEIRRSYDRLISTKGFPILIRQHLHIELGPRAWARDTFHKGFMSYNPILVKIRLALTCKIMIVSVHNFARHNSSAVVTCANLWHDWIIRIDIVADIIFTRFYSWAHKPLVK